MSNFQPSRRELYAQIEKLEKEIKRLFTIVEAYDSKTTLAIQERWCEKHSKEAASISFTKFTERVMARGCMWCLEAKVERLQEAVDEAI